MGAIMYPSFIIANPSKIMAVKILVNTLGQHTIAEVKQVTNKETEEILAYWVTEPRVISYRQAEGGGLAIDFTSPCPVAVTTEYAIRADYIVSILDAVSDVEQKYVEVVNSVPTTEPVAEEAVAEPEVTETAE